MSEAPQPDNATMILLEAKSYLVIDPSPQDVLQKACNIANIHNKVSQLKASNEIHIIDLEAEVGKIKNRIEARETVIHQQYRGSENPATRKPFSLEDIKMLQLTDQEIANLQHIVREIHTQVAKAEVLSSMQHRLLDELWRADSKLDILLRNQTAEKIMGGR